ncbi:MAG: hypothetical protein U1C49_02445, partial [Candidatus Andersenbacteria bacterium]|nr:hypothetical protein [Candidatus Andersenbacteria bacterium]
FYTGVMLLPWLLVAIKSFLDRPRRRAAAAMALIATAMTMSAQPQVVLYSFIIAATVGLALFFANLKSNLTIQQFNNSIIKYTSLVIVYTLISALLALSLSSFSILPLKEFIPFTERNADLPETELFDFSYPPAHAITLVAPYFFGDHARYWGAKGFQELAAFTGIIPLLLTAVSLFYWRDHKQLRIAALILFLSGIALALGQYSPVYRYLVEHRYLTTLSVAGRFVYFVDFAVAILAALGFESLTKKPKRTPLAVLLSAFIVLLIFLPFLLSLHDPTITARLISLLKTYNWQLVIALIGLIVFLLGIFIHRFPRAANLWPPALVITASFSLVAYGFAYNPTTLPSLAVRSPLASPLEQYTLDNAVPPRLYSRDTILTDANKYTIKPTSLLSPDFSAYQPIIVHNTNNPCFSAPMYAPPNADGNIEIALSQTVTGPPVATQTITAYNISQVHDQTFCFNVSLPSPDATYYLSFKSQTDNGISLYTYSTSTAKSAYFVRVANPTTEQIEQSQKYNRLEVAETSSAQTDPENLIFARHLQATANTSSARWIGALSIRPYREFIETFFANDNDQPFDGEGLHAIQRHRKTLDLAGVTHLAQIVPPQGQDNMPANNFQLTDSVDTNIGSANLYINPQAFPKAFLVPNAIFQPADDEARAAMTQNNFNPAELIYVSGPKPPADDTLNNPPVIGTATITDYGDGEATVNVDTQNAAWLVVTDSTLPMWQTTIDGQPAPYYVADTVFKTAYVPAGNHTVTFRYHSPAIAQAKIITLVALILVFCLIIYPVSAHARSSLS